jgi:hypothetical protein
MENKGAKNDEIEALEAILKDQKERSPEKRTL